MVNNYFVIRVKSHPKDNKIIGPEFIPFDDTSEPSRYAAEQRLKITTLELQARYKRFPRIAVYRPYQGYNVVGEGL